MRLKYTPVFSFNPQMENIFVQFKNNGQNIGPPLSIPKSTNYIQLNRLFYVLGKAKIDIYLKNNLSAYLVG